MPPAFVRRPDPHVYAIAAVLGAAALVLYLQQRTVADARAQTAVVLHEIAEQTAHAVVADVRSTLDGPVFDTLTAVNHPQIRESRLDLLAAEYREGLDAYPHVERFFVWTEQTDVDVPGEVLFLGKGHENTRAHAPGVPAPFERDAELGREIFALAQRSAPSQQIYAARAHMGPDGVHDVFLRLFWTDARRDRFFAVLGFVVDRARVRQSFIPELHRRRLEHLLKLRGENLPFELRVRDERGEVVWGPQNEQPLAAKVAMPMLFYPAQTMGSRLATAIEPVSWTVEVSPAHADQLLAVTPRAYWLPVLSVLLMLVAIVVTLRAARRAASVARMQSEFVSHVSHQLKTPLSLISAATETVELDRVQSPEKVAQYLGIIRNEVSRLSALVHRILEFSSVQGRQLEMERVDVATLARGAVEAFEASLAGRRFAFRYEQDGPSVTVDADPAALEQVLANLLDNAVKYSGDARTITVRVGRYASGATIDVIDSGIGVAASDRTRIFERFYRGGGEAHHRHGFGLGLAIARDLVEAHRGRLDLRESGPHGSTFRIWLPASQRFVAAAARSALEYTP
ncbi:MAG: HAMP domain-containing sensor histidine kinase [Vicinamibacterales bacterium]